MAYNKKAVLAANTEAIRVVLRLEKERREATEAEKWKSHTNLTHPVKVF